MKPPLTSVNKGKNYSVKLYSKLHICLKEESEIMAHKKVSVATSPSSISSTLTGYRMAKSTQFSTKFSQGWSFILTKIFNDP